MRLCGLTSWLTPVPDFCFHSVYTPTQSQLLGRRMQKKRQQLEARLRKAGSTAEEAKEELQDFERVKVVTDGCRYLVT
jgi:hypothetical protein